MVERIIEISKINDRFMMAKFSDISGRQICAGLHTLARQVETRMDNESMVVFGDNVDMETEAEFCDSMLSFRDQLASIGIKLKKGQE